MDPQRRPTFPAIPQNEIPASVQFRLVLAHTDNLALWMTNMRVYSTGLTFTLEAGQRNGDRFLGMYGFGKPESGHTPPTLFGIEDSAGTISPNLPRTRSGLRPGSGGGGMASHAMNYSLTPLPAPGPMQIYVAWPHFGINETRFDFDTTAIHEAAAQVIALWPPGDAGPGIADVGNRTTPQIEVPSGGWFESAADKQKLPPPDPDAPRRINFGHIG
ncbi:hypothetical protein ABIC28_003464 [Rhodococcus sp. PvR044]|jgi:hypothetical protein|uniref:hypothetical protein n=1 Tax=Rhodococcus sp. PvR044 TaxID=3156402 RepID=UPI00339676EB